MNGWIDRYLNPNSNLLSVLCFLFKNKYCYFTSLFLINTLLVCWFICFYVIYVKTDPYKICLMNLT